MQEQRNQGGDTMGGMSGQGSGDQEMSDQGMTGQASAGQDMGGQGMSAQMQIKEHMPVVCSDGGQFATVDRVEGSTIKLTKDDQGQHHWIPLGWVERVDQHVHIDRPGQQAMREWMTGAPSGSR